MTDLDDSAFPAQVDIRVRQADLGRDGSASTIGVARWLEDARLRVRLRRFERLVGAGRFRPFRILLVNQCVERLAPAGRAGESVQVHSGVRRIGRSSFTFEHAVFADSERVGGGEATIVLGGAAGPLTLPDELSADLSDLQMPEPGRTVTTRPSAERHQRDHYAYFAPLRSRIGDVDSNQHVNFNVLATWYDEAVAAFTTEAIGAGEGGPVPDLPPWSYRIQYIGEVTYPGDYGLGVRVRSFDGDSVHYALGVFRGGECLGVADAIGACGELSAKSLEASQTAKHG